MASKYNCHFCEKIQLRLHQWPLVAWPGHFSGQNNWPIYLNIVAKSGLASNWPPRTIVIFVKKFSCACTYDPQWLDQGIFLTKILGWFIWTLSQNLVWPLMASKEKCYFCEKIQLRLHQWPPVTWPGYFSGQNTWPVHLNIVAKSGLTSNGLQWQMLFLWKNPVALAPMTPSDLTRAFFWPKYLAGSSEHCRKIWIGL